MIFPFRFMAEVEQHIRYNASLQRREERMRAEDGAVNNTHRLYFGGEFVHCAFDVKRM